MARVWVLLLCVGPLAAAEPSFFDDAKLDALAKRLITARDDAVEFIFDNQRYGVPARASKGWRVGIDKQPGQVAMERKVAAAIILHNQFTKAVAKGLGIPTRVVGRSTPTTTPPKIRGGFCEYGIVVIDEGVKLLIARYARLREVPDGLPKALVALSKSKWADAKKHASSLRGARALAWELLRAAAVLYHNEQHPARHNTNERGGVRAANAYRYSLGLPPWVLDPQVHSMAKDFVNEMARYRFFSHYHPRDPSRRTLGHRVRRVRYRGRCGENASSMAHGARAVWRWRADAGHHRLLLMNFRAAGMGCGRATVLNVGTTTKLKIRGIYGPGHARR